MIRHPLEGAFYRVTRAREHLDDLKPRFDTLIRENVSIMIAHFQANSGNEIPTPVHIDVTAPMSIAVRIGEFVYNLRTALEYMVFQIAKLDSGAAQDMTQFPIESTRDKFRAWAKKASQKGINEAHIAAFERFQPYNGCGWSGILADLSNKDKHREFTSFQGDGKIVLYFREDDAIFDALPLPVIRAKHPTTEQEIDMKINVTANISFHEGEPTMETLDRLRLGVVETLEAFKAEFEG